MQEIGLDTPRGQQLALAAGVLFAPGILLDGAPYAHGRLSEMLGSVAVSLDHGLRLLDPTRAVPAILAGLPAESREWLDGFVYGINHVVDSGGERPLELRLLDIEPARWTAEDVLGVARVAAADVNWLLWARLLRTPRGEDWPELWARLLAEGAPVPSLAGGCGGDTETLARIVLALGRAGSNAIAVAPGKSRTGAAWPWSSNSIQTSCWRSVGANDF